MEGTIHTLQEYMLHTESITYILIVGALLGVGGSVSVYGGPAATTQTLDKHAPT